ncbi:MAG: protein of unknown function DUF1622, partial [uncultured Nocardioides sp.]
DAGRGLRRSDGAGGPRVRDRRCRGPRAGRAGRLRPRRLVSASGGDAERLRGCSTQCRAGHPAGPGAPDHRRHRAHHHGRRHLGQCSDPGVDRARPDLPQLLPRGRARGQPSVAAGRPELSSSRRAERM